MLEGDREEEELEVALMVDDAVKIKPSTQTTANRSFPRLVLAIAGVKEEEQAGGQVGGR